MLALPFPRFGAAPMKPLFVVSSVASVGLVAAAAVEPVTLYAVVAALGGAIGVLGKGYFDARKVEKTQETREVETLVKALVTTTEQRAASQDRLIEKLLTDQAHLTNRVDTAEARVSESQAAHHKCELTCTELQGRLALLERDRDISKTAEKTIAAAVTVVEKAGEANAPTT